MPHRRVDRRGVLLGAAASGVGLAASRVGAATAGDGRPNIVFILADDMGYADVACYGRPDVRTPNIDRIAARGAKLTQAYANSAVCTATRVALLTGRYQYRLPIGLEEPLGIGADIGLPTDHPTLPSLLKRAGYHTTLLGKWHLGYLPKYGPLQSGYDEFYGFRSGGVDYFTHKSGKDDDLWDGDTPVQQAGYLTDLLGDRAVKVVREQARRAGPFLISLHFSAPHWPWEGPGDENKPSASIDETGDQKTYQAMIERLDFQIGRVMRALEATGQAKNTIVVFTSDNGGERFAYTWPFTGRKTELLEGGLRVPALISWPGHIPAGRIVDQTAMSMDWAPTLLAAAGAAADPAYPLDGMNLLPTLTRGAAPVSRKLYWRYKANHQRAMRDGDYKVLKILDNTFLFNVVADPLERATLKAREPAIYRRMTSEWSAWSATMLPETLASFTAGNNGRSLADHFGAVPPGREPDDGLTWPNPPAAR